MNLSRITDIRRREIFLVDFVKTDSFCIESHQIVKRRQTFANFSVINKQIRIIIQLFYHVQSSNFSLSAALRWRKLGLCANSERKQKRRITFAQVLKYLSLAADSPLVPGF